MLTSMNRLYHASGLANSSRYTAAPMPSGMVRIAVVNISQMVPRMPARKPVSSGCRIDP